MNHIDGKIAVITGGTQGLGAAIARLFAKAGAAGIAIVGRDQAKGDALARQITQDSGVPVQMIAADMGEMGDVMRVVSGAFARFGQIDIVVVWGADHRHITQHVTLPISQPHVVAIGIEVIGNRTENADATHGGLK